MTDNAALIEAAQVVLGENQRGDFTIPAEGLYPHQWLWDSCFIAIGLRHYDIERAQKEILSLLRGQWSNGMMPHMIFAGGIEHRAERNVWRSWINPHAPDHLTTSGITQPPMLAEAVTRIGEKLSKPERRTWYQTVYPALLAHHEWLYRERDPHEEGLTLQVHIWETGLDNSPPWMYELHEHQLSTWIRIVAKTRFGFLLTLLRGAVHHTRPGQRLSTIDALGLYSVQRRLRRKQYDIDKILRHSLFIIEDLAFNSIFIRANTLLKKIAKDIGKDLPEELVARMKKTEETLEALWDGYSGQYYSRNFITHKLIKESSIATLLPLYAGSITKERASQLVGMLDHKKFFGPKYPVPSVPINSDWFKEHGYWQGPTWLNTNWLIIDGLKRYGFKDLAANLTEKTLELIDKSGFYEYFSPLDGSPAGAHNFSWTAALTIDLAKTTK
jgi:hypothetical protein